LIRITARATNDVTLLTVEDSGPGIPETEVPHVFERFHRATGAQGGAGLGLAIAAKVVADTGGRWFVGRSDLGGALMAVRWPRGARAAIRASSRI
jgi:signal transduction histidine kinase